MHNKGLAAMGEAMLKVPLLARAEATEAIFKSRQYYASDAEDVEVWTLWAVPAISDMAAVGVN